MLIWLEIWEIFDSTSFIKEWLVDKMPSGLIRSSSEFNFISKGSAFNEWMFTFVLSVRWIGFLKDSEDVFNLLKNSWVFYFEDILSNSGNKEMTVVPPGLG